MGRWIGNPHKAEESRFAIYDALEINDFKQIREIFFSLYASIPNDWFRKNRIDEFEGYYASVFYAAFAALGLDIVPEDVSNQGRLDMAVKFNGQVYLFEFKVVEDEAEGKALAQIKAKKYADKYRSLQQPIYLIGVEFSKKKRNVVEVRGGAFAMNRKKFHIGIQTFAKMREGNCHYKCTFSAWLYELPSCKCVWLASQMNGWRMSKYSCSSSINALL
ncbi:MAG: PD-(D/E)XK nuclease domain-containing protein [Zoogloeaceae bacterium]|nr:PD-(D/E)XK nuclease domain-containing protein [Zoogloeaceae bacterium]